MKGHTGRRAIVILTGLLCAALWAAFLIKPHLSGRAGPLDGFENRAVDLRFRLTGPRNASPDVAIVAIDDKTITSGTTTGRSLLTLLITNIAQSGARALAMDVLLAEPGDAALDAALADALRRLPSVIAAAAVFPEEGEGPVNVIWPQPLFQDAAQAGFVNLSTDAGGTPRYVPLLIDTDGDLRPALPLLAALADIEEKAAFGKDHLTLGDLQIPLDGGFNMPLRFLGTEGSVQTISAKGLLKGPMPDALSGRIVVLGFTASAMGDRFPTPFDDNTPGVEIIATAISQLTGGPTLQRDNQIRLWDAGHAAILTMLSVGALLIWPLSRALPLALLMISGSMVAVILIFASGIWMSAALPLAAALPPVIITGAARYVQERQQANRSEQAVASLRRFQSPVLANKIEEDPDYLATPLERDLVIFFVDLTGFTGLSQRLGPRGTRDLLGLFHTLASNAVETREGIVFNYMGDGAIAVFGLEPETATYAADNALAAAFDLARSVSKQQLPMLPKERLGCRIGLHAGPATLSRMGAQSHQQVTVTGDSVNLASRLMEVAKTEEAIIVASSDFFAALENPIHRDIARQTEVLIRGRTGTVQILTWSEQAIAQKG